MNERSTERASAQAPHRALARALDEGGQVWEGKRKYRSLEEVMEALDRGIADWLSKHE